MPRSDQTPSLEPGAKGKRRAKKRTPKRSAGARRAPRRRRARHRAAELAFDTLSIEGGLLAPEWLSRVGQLAADQQAASDYHVPKGLDLRDEIGRYWRIAQAHWSELEKGRASEGEPMALARRFVAGLLRESLGFTSLIEVSAATVSERTYPIGHAALEGRVPVVIAAAGSGLDTAAKEHGEVGRRRSAFGLAQEYLNAEDDALWGIASDGDTLRILRDNASLTRPAWIQADLARMFQEERYAEFAALWLLAHESRYGRPGQPVTECALEAWRAAGREQGTRAREDLRRGVQDALVVLGQGFLDHPDNGALRSALQEGSLTRDGYYQQLLRFAYRLIFLLTVEERELLHPPGTPDEVRDLYARGYALRRLRERAVKRSAHDRQRDLWEATKIVFRGVAEGEARLGLPALAGLFAADQCPDLDVARLANRALLHAMFRLSWLREEAGLARVNWRDMGPEELGSVYESLLELVPKVGQGARKFSFAGGGEARGNARKSSGSYYTPDSLVQVLLDTALEPVIQEHLAAQPDRPVEALLELCVVDPACGSGHFLLGAARRLATHVARLTVEGTPSPSEYRHALRRVVAHCVYGVDLNPLAVELCKVSLWLEAVEPGLPLTFLDAHIRLGNSLLGATPELMADGIPDDAWKPLPGDDKKIARDLKKRNNAAVEGQGELFAGRDAGADGLAAAIAVLEAAPDDDKDALAEKEKSWQAILASDAFVHRKLVADAWCAAFLWPKRPGAETHAAPTNDIWWRVRDRQGTSPPETLRIATRLAERYRFFHWHLAFPHVFERGGFDVVLGNPPWERIKLQEKEFFASRDDEIAGAANAAARKKLIAALPEGNPPLWEEWQEASREASGQSHFVRSSARYPLCGTGDINTFALFAEHNRSIVSDAGAAGFIVPAGIATDHTTRAYFQNLVDGRSISSLYHFENEERLFVGVNNMMRFVLMTLRGKRIKVPAMEVVAFARNAEALRDPERKYRLRPEEIALVNPNSRTFPTFPTRRDADLNLAIYGRAGVLWREDDPDGNPWGLRFMRMLDMANDSGLFHSPDELEADGWKRDGNVYRRGGKRMLPLYEAKMIHHFDHRFATYEGATQANRNKGTLPHVTDEQHADPAFRATPNYWVDESEVDKRLEGRWDRGWLLGWRDITNAHNERTVIFSLIPRTAVGHTAPLALLEGSPELAALLCANLNSHVLDYASRQKIGGSHLTYGYLRQLPVLVPTVYSSAAPWTTTTVTQWLLPRILELSYTAHDLGAFASDLGFNGPPFRWEPTRRALIRAELDAAFFHLYGLSRDDTGYVLDTFPVVRKNDEKEHGEYRTKRLILDAYDAMAEAIRTGISYRSPVIDNA